MPSAKVRPPRVGEAKAHLECEVAQIFTDGGTNIVLARILHAHVDPSVWRDGRVDPKLLDPACRLAGSGYARLGELVNVQRPEWAKVKGPRARKRCRARRGANAKITHLPIITTQRLPAARTPRGGTCP